MFLNEISVMRWRNRPGNSWGSNIFKNHVFTFWGKQLTILFYNWLKLHSRMICNSQSESIIWGNHHSLANVNFGYCKGKLNGCNFRYNKICWFVKCPKILQPDNVIKFGQLHWLWDFDWCSVLRSCKETS